MAAAPSTKRALIDKANTRMVVVAAIAAFIIAFALVASKTLVSQLAYQNRLTAAKQTALNQLKADVVSSKSLITSYKAFVNTPQNIIGGNPDGQGPNDGDNGQIVLDALPSSYDFPALITSVNKLLTNANVKVDSISGTDEQVTEQSNQSSGNPTPVAMPFEFSVDGSYQDIQNVMNEFQNSIRPFQIQSMELSGDQSDITLSVTAQTFYQPEKVFKITNEVVK